jgi:hypothetical protein
MAPQLALPALLLLLLVGTLPTAHAHGEGLFAALPLDHRPLLAFLVLLGTGTERHHWQAAALDNGLGLTGPGNPISGSFPGHDRSIWGHSGAHFR